MIKPDMLHNRLFRLFCLTLVLVAGFLAGCKSDFSGFSYDPEGAEVTTDKEIHHPHRRTIGFAADSLWASAEATATRLSDFYRSGDHRYTAWIKPERLPVNNSPWYAFKLYGERTQPFELTLRYQGGTHRYPPKLSSNGEDWRPMAASRVRVDSASGSATLSFDGLKGDTLWVAAQEMRSSRWMDRYLARIALHPLATLDTVGYTELGRPIPRVILNKPQSDRAQKGVLLLLSRQHPPEIAGALAFEAFLEGLLSESPLLKEFFEHFTVVAYPLANPDGADLGHWRLNANGVDLNRDWQAFHQPETEAIRRATEAYLSEPGRRLFYGIDFHATDEHVVYPILKEIETFPDDFSYRWLDSLRVLVPEYRFRSEPFDTSSPIAKNWIYRTFGADAITFEVYDETDRAVIDKLGFYGAEAVAELLIEAYKRQFEEQLGNDSAVKQPAGEG